MEQKQYKPEYIDILSLLKKYNNIIIPIYQRQYSWKTENIQLVMNDLKNIIDNKNIKNHFMGILVTYNIEKDGFVSEIQIIDGQQRLTSMFLILYAMIDVFKDKDLSKNIKETYLEYKGIPKLSMEQNDGKDFELITNAKLSLINESSSNLVNNYKIVKYVITRWINEGVTLNNVLNALENMYFLIAPFDKNDDAQKIFESINSTGVELTKSDLIKNFIMMNHDSDKQKYIYKKYWRFIDEKWFKYDSKIVEHFFKTYIEVIHKQYCRPSQMFDLFKKYYQDQITINNNVDDILDDIIKYAECYYVLTTHNDLDKKIKSVINEFRDINFESPLSFLIWIYKLYKLDENITLNDFVDITQLTITYVIRRDICDRRTSDLSDFFPYLLKQVYYICEQEKSYQNIVDITKYIMFNIQKNSKYDVPNDVELENVISNKNFYQKNKSNGLLVSLFTKMSEDISKIPVDKTKYSIEHIMPQKPDEHWLQKSKAKSLDEYYEYVHKLGNLTYIPGRLNSEIGNRDEKIKMNIYRLTSYLRHPDLLTEEDIKNWSIEKINKTSKIYYEIIKELYPYKESKNHYEILDEENKPKKTTIKNKTIKTKSSDTKNPNIDLEFKNQNIDVDNTYLDNNIFRIYYKDSLVDINAIYNKNNGEVTILKNSLIFKCDYKKYLYCEDKTKYKDQIKPSLKYKQLLEDGYIVELDDYAIVENDICFIPEKNNSTALTLSAHVIALCKRRGGFDFWFDSQTGKTLSFNKEKYERKSQKI